MKRNLTEQQIIEAVVKVAEWNSSPPGMPVKTAYYYFDYRRGWSYLTPAGIDFLNQNRNTEPMASLLAAAAQRREEWARRAVQQILAEVNNA